MHLDSEYVLADAQAQSRDVDGPLQGGITHRAGRKG